MNRPTSYSQNTMFEGCPRCWYLSYVEKIRVPSDLSYADAGNVVHESLEEYFNNKRTLDEIKAFFNINWNEKKLDDTHLKLKKDNYWLMVVNAINLNLKITSNELKIFFPDVVGYIDVVNTDEDFIGDWKTGSRTDDSQDSYIKQLKFYSWLYYRKFDRIPKKASIFFLKYNGSKVEFTFVPTMDDVKEMELWHNNIRHQMDEVIKTGTIPKRCDTCFSFCPYIETCSSKEGCLKYVLHITGNYIQLEGMITQLLSKGLHKKFSYELKNAYWMKKANRFARTEVKFWDEHKRLIPIGFRDGLVKTLKDYADYQKVDLSLEVVDHRQFDKTEVKMPDKFVNQKELRDYQSDAADEFLRKGIGILEMGTGSGKTEVAIECIRRLGVRTLFIVDKIELMRQTKQRIEESLGIEVGQLGQGIEDIKDVTVATVQTLVKHLRQHSKYLQTIRFVIFDETHKVASASYWKISQHLTNTEYRMGISGTAFRDDGNDMVINAVTGYKVYDLSSKVLIQKGWLVKPRIIFIKGFMTKEVLEELERKAKTGLINETPNYSNYYDSVITTNPFRNNVILHMVNMNKGKKILILTKLIEHGATLNRLIDNSRHLYGSTNKEERAEIFEQFTNGNLDVLISTISIFAEGIDIPALDTVINASANRGDVKTIQVLGRVLRKIEGKKDAKYFDFIDESPFFKSASFARRKALFREGHDIEITDSQSLNND